MDQPKLDNVKLLYHLWGRKDLSDKERIVAIALASVRNEETGRCALSQQRIAQMLDCSRELVAKIIRKLRSNRVIVSDKIPTKDLAKSYNLYFFKHDYLWYDQILNSPNSRPDPEVKEAYAVTKVKLQKLAKSQIKTTQATPNGTVKVFNRWYQRHTQAAAEHCPATIYETATYGTMDPKNDP